MTSRYFISTTLLSLLLALGGCQQSKDSTKTVTKDASHAQGLSLARLASLDNYRAAMTVNPGPQQMVITHAVHSPTNWAATTPLTTRHIGGNAYTKFGNDWQVEKDASDAYSHTNLPSVAKQFFSMTHVSHVKVTRGKACQQAQLAGHEWHISAAAGGLLQETFSACVADRSGALLTLKVTAGGSAMKQAPKVRESYKIVSVGDVKAFTIPTHIAQ